MAENTGNASTSMKGSSDSRKLLTASLTFAFLAVAALAIDVPLSRYLDLHRVRGDLLKIINLAEVFGHGYGATAILISAWVLCHGRGRAVVRAAAATFGVGLLVNLVKACVVRIRPEHFDLALGVRDSFVSFFTFHPPSGFSRYFDSRLHSFPSGHTATAVMLAIGLTSIVPRGKWLFATFACMAAAQRVVSRDHFLSDTLVSTALAFGLAAATNHCGEIWRRRRELARSDAEGHDRPPASWAA